ncbi:ATP-binding protein [Streptomyces sp. NPDC048567]|uniref:ATP-binding protein n=1 Tax=Streptomyces sp. NPDC048567 TaxID=3365570 RepID=UPI003723AB09
MPEVQEAGRLRSWIVMWLTRAGLGHLADDLTLIASELAANALVHGGGPARADVRIADRAGPPPRVRLEVTDLGRGFDLDAVVRTWEDSGGMLDGCRGRGLFIVAELSHRWGVRRDRGGHTVWAELG